MNTISELLTEIVLEAAERAGHAGVLDDVEPAVATNNPKFGDYQSNHAFRLGKALRTNPRQVAEQVCNAIADSPAVQQVSVAGPGFLNFTLSAGFLAEQVQAVCADDHGGVPQHGSGKTAVIDFSSPNVAKRMHIGHMRSTIIGDALVRLHRAAGWRVVGDNHIGDWGTQFGKLIVAHSRWLDSQAFETDPIGELERIYVKFNQEVGEHPELDDLARAETAKLQAGDEANRELWQSFIEISMREFDKVYERLGISFEETLGESAYNDALPGVVESLEAAGIATRSDGAIVVRFADDAAAGLAKSVLVIRKQDGAFLYGTTDLATLAHRQATWNPQRIVYVTDTRQQLHFRQVFAAWQQWRPQSAANLVHIWFGMLKMGDDVIGSRKGNVIRLVDLLDEAVRRARVVVDSKSEQLTEGERAAIAEAVGVGAVRYADLSQNPQSDVTFDWDRMLSLEGNTAPFLMYSYARARSILGKAGSEVSVQGIRLVEPQERELALMLARTPEAMLAALAHHRPNLLCEHLYSLAAAFNRFYRECPVLRADDAEVRESRLALVKATTGILGKGMGLLGVATLDRM